MVRAELHSRVDLLGRRDPFREHEERFVDHRHENPVHDEAGRVPHADRRLVETLGQRTHGRRGRIARLQPADDLDERHQRHRVEEMHADETRRIGEQRRERGNRDRRRVRRNDRVGPCDRFDLLQNAALQLDVFGCGLDHDVDRRELRVIGRGRDACERGIARGGGELVFRHQPLEAALQRRESLLERGVRDVDHHDVESCNGGGLRNAVAHGSGAYDADGFDGHDDSSYSMRVCGVERSIIRCSRRSPQCPARRRYTSSRARTARRCASARTAPSR
ncbi:hypothetical protein FEP39_05166 [Burkholderia multivorans]|nr:hypothetical protein [Burkholderia multivorans]MDR9071911.1 hypothetical protein [Burkholderia multivorans]MDR9083711.1 hypothetical protein [Burkholderia multivorans]MDR9125274.1 hypothetical protein [Burkholderia multivorans]MDR9136931.1 hypothetical protein [Burkholderia multivorans]